MKSCQFTSPTSHTPHDTFESEASALCGLLKFASNCAGDIGTEATQKAIQTAIKVLKAEAGGTRPTPTDHGANVMALTRRS